MELKMFSSDPNNTILKPNLRFSINQLKFLQKKKTELAQKARKEIADYIAAGKAEIAKIRVEYIIREEFMVEAMEIVEMYCDLLLARFGMVTQMKELDEGLAEAISSLIWVAPRMQMDGQELKIIGDLLSAKYGKPFADACRNDSIGIVSEKLKHKLHRKWKSPPKILIEKYLTEIAINYNVFYEPDPQVLREYQGKDALHIDINNGYPRAPGFADFPQPPPMPFLPPHMNVQPFSYPTEEMNNLPPAYDSLSPDDNLMNSNVPKPQPRSKFPPADNFLNFPDLPSVPSERLYPSPPSNSGNNFPHPPKDDIDFDDLAKRFEELKKKK